MRWSLPWRAWWRADDGQVSAFVTVLVVAILALTGLSLDGGLALAAKVAAGGQAQSAARAGAQMIDLTRYRSSGELMLDRDRAESAASEFLAAAGAAGIVRVAGDTVTVEVTATAPTQVLGLIGIQSLTVHGSGSAHARRGVNGVEP
jgi:hypothetical protein